MRTQSTAIKLFQGSLFLFMGLCLAASSRADGLAPGTLNVVTVDLQGQNPETVTLRHSSLTVLEPYSHTLSLIQSVLHWRSLRWHLPHSSQ